MGGFGGPTFHTLRHILKDTLLRAARSQHEAAATRRGMQWQPDVSRRMRERTMPILVAREVGRHTPQHCSGLSSGTNRRREYRAQLIVHRMRRNRLTPLTFSSAAGGALVGAAAGNPVAGAVVGGLGGASIGAATAPER